METQISQKDKEQIEAGIQSKYVKVAENPEGLFKYPTGLAGLEALDYDPGLIRALPEAVIDSYCGAGNPFSLGPINERRSTGHRMRCWSGHHPCSNDDRSFRKSGWG